MKAKPVIVLGATPNPARYAHKAVRLLKRHGHRVIPVGIRQGEIDGVPIRKPDEADAVEVHTVTVYLSPGRQREYEAWVERWKPQRVIFNPGTENEEWRKRLEAKGVEVEERCTLVMLHTGEF